MKHRHVGSHQLNMESSRSHALMTIHTSVMGTDPAAWDYGTPRYGKICFVDLAGSERLKVCVCTHTHRHRHAHTHTHLYATSTRAHKHTHGPTYALSTHAVDETASRTVAQP